MIKNIVIVLLLSIIICGAVLADAPRRQETITRKDLFEAAALAGLLSSQYTAWWSRDNQIQAARIYAIQMEGK